MAGGWRLQASGLECSGVESGVWRERVSGASVARRDSGGRRVGGNGATLPRRRAALRHVAPPRSAPQSVEYGRATRRPPNRRTSHIDAYIYSILRKT